MQDNGTFHRLSQSLGNDEKQQLLQKLKSNTVIQEDIITRPAEEQEEEKNAAILYAQLPWYRKLWFFMLSVLWNKSREDLFMNHLISTAGHDIDLHYPGMYDHQNALLLPGALDELMDLKEAARFLSSVLDAGVLSNYSAFLVFLASLEMPEVHDRLQKLANPSLMSAENPRLSDIKLKKMAISEAENTISVINEERRAAMYNDVHALVCLKELAFFLFDRLILAFNTGSHSEGAGQICPFSVIKNQLTALNNILFSFKKMPSTILLSSMYVFVIQNENNEKELDSDREMQRFTSNAEKALFTIRSFVAKVPLTAIIRCGTKDLTYEPCEISSNREWFSVFREKWIETIAERFNNHISNRKRNDLQNALSAFFEDKEIRQIEYIQSDDNPEGIPIKEGVFLSFLMTFHRYIFMGDMNSVLRPILLDGEFYKRENRIEFTESYNELIKVDDLIMTIEKKLMPSGEWGKQWQQINTEIQSVAVKRRKTSIFLEEVNMAVERIVDVAKKSLSSLENILTGILQPESSGGKYETLSNMPKIAGKGNEFMTNLNLALKNIKIAVRLITDIEQIDAVD